MLSGGRNEDADGSGRTFLLEQLLLLVPEVEKQPDASRKEENRSFRRKDLQLSESVKTSYPVELAGGRTPTVDLSRVPADVCCDGFVGSCEYALRDELAGPARGVAFDTALTWRKDRERREDEARARETVAESVQADIGLLTLARPCT